MQRAARQDVLADERLRRTIREARELNDEAVGQWLVSKRIGNTCHTFAPNEGDLDRVSAACIGDERDDARIDEVEVFGDRSRRAQQVTPLEWMGFQVVHELSEHPLIGLRKLSKHIVACPF